MRPTSRPGSLCFALFAALCSHVPAAALELPAGFVDEPLPYTFSAPTKLAFLEDGRLLVAEKSGLLWMVADGRRRLLWAGEPEVLNTYDLGLMSVAAHPDFGNHPWIYLLYSCDPDTGTVAEDTDSLSWGRLVRYRLSDEPSEGLDLASRQVLLGADWKSGWPAAQGAHHVDDLAWGRDGTLFVSAGDGGRYDAADAGGNDPRLFEPGRVPPVQDIGAFRAQMLGSLSGKVLRVDPETGLGLASNPFYDGDPRSVRSRVWSYGHRNPFRIAFQPWSGSTDPDLGDPGTLYVGDVGWNTWEELDILRHGGGNYGWPCDEGPEEALEYRIVDPAHHGCSILGTILDPVLPSLPGLYLNRGDPDYSHPRGQTGALLVGGAFYTGQTYPPIYRSRYFFADAGEGWIRVVVPDANGEPAETLPFATDADLPVSFATEPATGDLFYVSVVSGLVHRVRFGGPLAAPPAAAVTEARVGSPTPNPSRGAVTLALSLPAPARVGFEVLDALGRSVWRAPEAVRAAGASALLWPGITAAGGRARPGLYFARVEIGGRRVIRRVALAR